MKAILEFNLPEDEDDFKRASTANQIHYAVWQLDQWLRSQIKYPPESMTQDAWHAYDDCRKKLNQLLNENNVNFE